MESQSVQSQDLEHSSNLSPSQQMMYNEIEKMGIAKYLPIIGKIIPNSSTGIGSMFNVIKDPELLHRAVEEIVVKLQEVIRLDHEFGIHTSEERNAPGSEEESGRVSECATSVRGGQEGDGQEHTVRSVDDGIPERLLETESPSENLDSGHQAEVQGIPGDEWLNDWP